MKPAKPRPPPTLSQRVQDTAERLSTLAKAEIYQVLEGTAPAGDFSSFYRLDPLINDIVLQLIDNFKQAVTKRLLPEACKLLGSRPAALATPDPWTGGEAPQPQSPGALPTSVKQHTHLENDILALGLSPGTGQPLRPDQGPPQDAASAAASSLLQGTTVSASGSTPQPPSLSTPPSASASSGGGSGASAALHPQESRFAFANAGGGDSRRTATLQSPLSRDGAYAAGGGGGGGAATDLGQAADPLLFLGLGDSGTPLGFSSGGDAAAAAANGLAIAVDSFLLGSSLAGSIGSGAGGGSSGGGGRVTPGGGTFTPVTSPSPNSVSRQYGTLSLGGVGVGGSAAAAAIRSASSAASSPSPNPSTPSPYPALPLAIRPGSSLDPGLATPPLSLAGTEPLRGPSHGLQLHLPQAAYDNRNPTGSYAMQNVIEMPYDVQLLYGNSGAGVMDLHQAGGFGAMGGGGGPTSQEYGTYGLAPLTAAAAAGMVDLMRAGSSGGTASTTVGTLQPSGIVSSTAGGFGGNAVGPGGIGRAAGGSPTMVLAAGAPGTAASRPSRSGNASAASMQDSRLGSFSTGPLTAAQPTAAPPPRRGSGNGGAGIAAVQSPFIPQRPSPPASDASGPSSSTASASTAGAAAAAAAAVGTAKGGGGSATIAAGDSASSLSMAAKLQQVRIYALARDNHVVLLKDFDEKVLTKMTLLVEKFGAAECLAMLDRIEEVLKGKAGRLANGPGYLDVSVSTRLDELKQRASGQVTAPEDYARSTLHSRIYAELRDLISRHGFLQWHHFDQGIINMLKKMPNATALERLNELAYHSFKNVDNPKSCIVSIFTTKPKYIAT
ncbi:hypothetical protein VOLCADRAFT_95237 [Volvox carteri f. nagariensis]|uniref:Uncharacterized protein n=1 Tax=Volvox carteri f. nagariensis TaxID=3068 RepID=D8U6Z1_VOLCA|nr:uncharacterized protein VOLCADRAFT_95237 [Volvox carteri f. nagariensis]EFJ44596.1 hypothetical protein VOLCADRAFT_95237 [Volvox carteri f. nagariensis]|eukprot:XP_002954446.1 hypothetical protein VOLCADRAFT_95237 [Volvox carteri f. nagariensis]